MRELKILKNVPLAPHTTFRLGGRAQFFVAVRSKHELQKAVRFAKERDIPFLVIGGGSNLLISDAGFSGLVIQNQIKGFSFFDKNNTTFMGVGAGENWDNVVALAVKRGLYGIENLSGIPGSVGATPIQNVGAYGAEVSDTIAWVEVLNTDTMDFELFTNKQCRFAYRDSFFKTKEGSKYIVTEVGFKLLHSGMPNVTYRDLINYFNERDVRPTLQNVRDAVLSIRSKKFPDLNQYGCGGSFFKNPVITNEQLQQLRSRFKDVPFYPYESDTVKVPLAWILEHAVPWKGVRRNSVGVSGIQPLILIHYGGGSAQDVKRLADDITQSVGSELNMIISPEVRFVGEFS